MIERKYLSVVLDVKDIVEADYNKFCIISGVGSGKNYFVENELAKYGNVLYISSRRAKVNEILVNELCNAHINWDNDFDDVTVLTNFGVESLVKNRMFERGIRNIVNHYSFIVIDEAHSIFTDASYTESSFHLHCFIEYVANNYPEIKIVLMTGTPEPMEETYLQDYIIFDKMSECFNVLPERIEIITREKALALLSNLSADEKSIYYSNFAAGIVNGKNSLVNRLIKAGYKKEDIAICMGKDSIAENEKHFEGLKENVENTRRHIVENSELPQESKILLTTSTLKEGINIEYFKKYNKKVIKKAFIESHLLSDIQQFAGRVRDGLDVLYVIDDVKQHEVTDEFLRNGELLFSYENKALLETTNKYFSEYIKDYESEVYSNIGFDNTDMLFYESFYKDDYSLYSIGGNASKFFIRHIENNNPYLRFNNLKGRFDLYSNKLYEQRRVNIMLKEGVWDSELDAFCELNDIEYDSKLILNRKLTEELNVVLKNYIGERLYYDDDKKEEFLNYLRDKLELKVNCKLSTINKALKEKDIKYKVISLSTSRNDEGGIRYLTVEETKKTSKKYLSAQELKWYIYHNGKIEYVLQSIGNHNIRFNSNTNYYICANYNGDNLNAVNVKNNRWLNVINWTRQTEFKFGSDIIDLVKYNKSCDFKTAVKYLHSILELSNNNLEDIDFISMDNDVEDSVEDDKTDTLIPISEDEIKQYIPMLHIDWFRDSIMPWARKKFDLRYSNREKRVVIPIRKWDDGTLVATNKRTTKEHFEDFGIKKYLLTSGYKKHLNLYGLWENKENIEKEKICTVHEGERSVLKRYTLNDKSGVSTHGKVISNEQVDIIMSLDIDEVVLSFDKDVELEEIRFYANKFYEKANHIKVSYIWDSFGLLSEKQSPADLPNKDYMFLFEHRIEYDEKEHELYLESLNRK